jgi:hypothetical protein
MGLGPLATLSLREAREKALEARQLRLEGIDPIDQRQAKRATARAQVRRAMTFRQCAEAYIAAHQDSWKNPKHRKQWPNSLAPYVYPVFGDMPVDVVDLDLVVKALEPIWKTKTETASRVRGPHRGGARLGGGAQISARRQPREVARAFAEALRPEERRRASRRAALWRVGDFS